MYLFFPFKIIYLNVNLYWYFIVFNVKLKVVWNIFCGQCQGYLYLVHKEALSGGKTYG